MSSKRAFHQISLRSCEWARFPEIRKMLHICRFRTFRKALLTWLLEIGPYNVVWVIAHPTALLTWCEFIAHYNDVIMSSMASQITSLTIVYSSVYSRRRSKKMSKLRVAGLYGGSSPVTGGFPAQRASNAENVSIWWLHHEHLTVWWKSFNF